MPRNCGVCSHRDRAELETRILRGDPVALVAADAGFSVSAVNRHRRNHLRTELRGQLATRTATHVSDFADQLAQLAGDADNVRQFAISTDNPDLLLRAIASKRDTLTTLMQRLGVDSDETVEILREAQAIVEVLVPALLGHPEAVADVVDHLRQRGEVEFALALADAVGASLQAPGAEANRAAKELAR